VDGKSAVVKGIPNLLDNPKEREALQEGIKCPKIKENVAKALVTSAVCGWTSAMEQ